MKRILLAAILVCFVFASLGCNQGGGAVKKTPSVSPDGTPWLAAVVTLGINDWGGTMTAGSGRNSAPYIDAAATGMLQDTEKVLGQYFTVVSVGSFVGKAEYRKLSLGKAKDGLFTPMMDGKVVPSFTGNQKEIIKCVLDQQTAASLCKALGVDRLVVIYTEWAVATGGFIPVSRALAKNCVAVYDATGEKLFFARKDVKGSNVIGGMGRVALNEEVIGQWSDAYLEGMRQIFARQL